MTEEFDEDVVFENSPLYQYLHDLGHTDFEACPTSKEEEEEEYGLEGDFASDRERQKTLGGRLWRLAEAVWRWSPIKEAAVPQKLQQQLDCVFGQYSVKCILDQDVLLQEDVELIELLDPSLLALASSSSSSSSSSGSPSRVRNLPRPSLMAKPSLWDMAALVGLASVLLGLCSSAEGLLWSLAVTPWSLALLGWMGVKGATLWRLGRLQTAVHARATHLQNLVHNSKTLTGLSRKALRLVQETEVISRGFTLVSAAGSFSRAGPGVVPRGQQLMGLRKVLYRSLRLAFRASRRATCHMLKEFPLNSEIDNVSNYVSAIPLKDLGLGLGIEHLSDEQAQELTDDYSLPALKMLYQLWLGQSSECFRRLALLLSPRRLEESEDGDSSTGSPSPTPLHRSISAVTEPLHQALSGCLCDVQRSFDFHRHFETQTRTTGSDKNGRARETCRELNTLHTSIRSLQLHLKALLSEMIILEDDLEKLMLSKKVMELSCESYQELSERLHHLQPHMQASTGCWDDTICQVERMLRRAGGCSGHHEAVQHCGAPVAETPVSPPSYPLILDRDPVPEELEWEAYVSDSDSDGEGRGSWSDMLSPEERERQRREREESRRVLSELKAVLGFRASEGERMKRKQLLFNDQAAPSACGEGSDPTSETSDVMTTSAELGGTGSEEGNHLSAAQAAGDQPQEEEGKNDGVRSDLLPEPGKEFSCGLEVKEGELGGGTVCNRGGGGASELHQYDGEVMEEEAESQNGVVDCFMKPRVPAITVLDRLTEIHGSQALSFSSSLAAQVAARSQSLINMEEQTFGDDNTDDDDDDDDDEEEEDDDDEEEEENDSRFPSEE
ncbi:vezatin isoform X2 [Cynoglossus semilaevis]|uniref:Vezatin n=1 Tax=Cynoglossus semilaevis TaxID=244447 RepID=A0A3P8V022_CYNSE|nr:vezatin isoform X2 [Cynoglossus semilaevis]